LLRSAEARRTFWQALLAGQDKSILAAFIREVQEQQGLSSDGMELARLANFAGALSEIREDFTKAVRDASYDNIAKVMSDAV
jgi:hypothetical protein